MAPKHILFTAFPAWGHVRPFCILAARIAKENKDTVFTLILVPNQLKKAQDEIMSEFQDAENVVELQGRVRVLSSFKEASNNPFDLITGSIQSYSPAYETLHSGQPIICATNGTVFEAVPPPVLIILDFFAFPQLQATRAITGTSVPILSWMTGHSPSLIRLFGPESHGGWGDFFERVEEEAAALGISVEEHGKMVFRATNGKVVKLPGVPDMYDYELFPQELPFEVPITMVAKGANSHLKESDGVLTVSPHAIEAPAIEAVRKWLSEWKKDVYAIGPLLPSSYGTAEQSHRGANDIKEFLDKMLIRKGNKSVILISFGTTFWPTDTGYLEEVVEAFIEKDFPFILSHASPFAKLSDEFIEKVNVSGLGLLTTWCPQQYILDHPATGWFLTHCGHNSLTEALASGIPLIAWPFEADQPTAALHLSSLNLAIELLQVRRGEHALKPLHRNGTGAKGTRDAVGEEIREVIDACRGDKGKELRKNAEKIKVEFKQTWEKGGKARKDFDEFLRKYFI